MSSSAKPGPEVTVVIPVWDAPYVGTVGEAVASVRGQADVPIVVVDNASVDPLPALEGVEVVRAPERLSAGAARNLGLGRIKTEYVVCLDADDLLPDDSLGYLSSELAADPAASACVGSILEAETGRRHRTPRRLAFALSRYPRLFALAHSIWSLYPIQGCAVMRTRSVREAGGYADASGGEDWVLGVSLAFRGHVLVDKRIGLVYRPGEASLWRANRSSADLTRGAALVRERMRSDPAVPRWARAALPAIAALQAVAIYAIRPLYRALRALRAPRSAPGEQPARDLGEDRERPPEVGETEPDGTAARQR